MYKILQSHHKNLLNIQYSIFNFFFGTRPSKAKTAGFIPPFEVYLIQEEQGLYPLATALL